jgi:hypothetical protein
MNSDQTGGIKLVVHYTLPSLNQVLAMNPWQRLRERTIAQVSVLCALKVSAQNSLMKGTSMTKQLQMHCDMLGVYVTTRRSGARSKSAKSKSG